MRRSGTAVLAAGALLSLAAFASRAASDAAAVTAGTVTVVGREVDSFGGLRNEVVKIESVSARDMARVNAANVLQAVEGRPGVSVQVECSICNVRNVVLNNLPGRYTTLSIDGVPLFSSLSNAYGLDSVGIAGLERIDIARGAGASQLSPEALGGAVNLVTRRPTGAEAVLQWQNGTHEERRGDLFVARPFTGGAFTVQGNLNEHDAVDGNGNGISEYTGYRRRIGGVGVFLDDAGGFRVRGRLDVIDEKRGGGALGPDHDRIRADTTGNPFDFSRGRGGSPVASGWVNPSTGAIIPYDGGRAGFSEIIDTSRVQSLVTGDRSTALGRLRIALGHARHRQDSFYEGDTYDARQQQSYAGVQLQSRLGDTLFDAGVDYRQENLRSLGRVGGTLSVDGIDNYVYRVPALFAQAQRSAFAERLEMSASIRVDRHNVFGRIASPRVGLLYHHDDTWTSRLAVGRGFRAPTSFFEQDHGILRTTRVLRLVERAEQADNVGYSLSHATDRFSAVLSLTHNRIRHMALLDPDGCLAAGGTLVTAGSAGCVTPVTVFGSASADTRIAGWDVTATWRVTPSLDATAGFEDYHYGFTSTPLFAGGAAKSPLVFARPRNRIHLRTDYEAHGWTVVMRATWTGPMALDRFYDYDSTPRFNLDGTPKLTRSPSFWTLDVTARYAVGTRLSLLAGVTNLFDYRQTNREDYLWVDRTGNPDYTQIWGPNVGRRLYVGARFDL